MSELSKFVGLIRRFPYLTVVIVLESSRFHMSRPLKAPSLPKWLGSQRNRNADNETNRLTIGIESKDRYIREREQRERKASASLAVFFNNEWDHQTPLMDKICLL